MNCLEKALLSQVHFATTPSLEFIFSFSLLDQLRERLSRVSSEITSLEGVDRTAADLADRLERLKKDVDEEDVWGKDTAGTRENLKVRLKLKFRI